MRVLMGLGAEGWGTGASQGAQLPRSWHPAPEKPRVYVCQLICTCVQIYIYIDRHIYLCIYTHCTYIYIHIYIYRHAYP